jgi:PAS domain S-box-containing protein
MIEKSLTTKDEEITGEIIKLEDVIDLAELRKLLDDFYQIAPFPLAILDIDGEVLLESHWGSLCTQFFRVNPECAKNCKESDTHFNKELATNKKKFVMYKCGNGLLDAASPIIINGQHLGNLYIGQFLLEEPDMAFFEAQAQKYRFPRSEYLKSLSEVPIVSEEELKNKLNYLIGFAEFLGNIGLKEYRRIKIEKNLRESEERYRLLFENANEAIFIAQDGKLKFLNPATVNIIGYSQSELLEKQFIEFIHPEDKNMVIDRHLQRLRGDDLTGKYLFRIVRKDDTIRWAELSAVLIEWGGEAATLNFLNDTTKRKQAEDALLETGSRYNDLIENMNSGVAVYKVINDGKYGKDYIIQNFNKFALRHEGLELKDIVGKSLKDIRPTIDDFGLIDTFRKVWKSGKPEFFPAKVYVDDKYSNYYENRVFRLPNWEIVAIYDDVSSQKNAETNLIESENLLREVINNMEKAVAIYEPVNGGEDFAFVDMNEFGEKITHYTIEDVRGKKISELFPEQAAIGLNAKLRETYQTGNSTRIPLKQYKDDRITQWVENFIFKLPSGKVVAMFEDTSEQRHAEDQIKKSLIEKETLLHEIHHRVKNNMQVINSLLNLQANAFDDIKIKNALKESQSRIYAMSAVHETLHGSEKLSEIDLKSYLSKITTSVFQSYSINHEKVRLNSDVDVSPIDINQAYPLGLIINELISNSLKYAFPDERSGVITVRMNRHDKELQLSVMDDGVGISEDLDWKNVNTLGLKLVRTLVENQLGGSIDLDRKSGTKFAIKFNLET